MRLLRELAVAVALLVIVGVLARSGVGRFVLPVVGLAVAAALVALLATQSAYPRTAVGPRTRIIESAAQSADAACVECGSPATARRRYVREWVVLGVPVVLLDDGENPVCDAHRD
ncbi:hypothetical protein [Haloferax volcanii]|uniref:DUF8108 domain-containing protein n=3 Tax=Haloferax volcanii TaxID=2246 RepID=A0A384KQB3_HALVD|nr:hypothetical protein [Haloferax volcanii]ADE03332.1 small CPxCG-related zinc finger protein [Haloferax volcanii DS2]ELY24357.1 hypothetical protein C498_18953 [Haloferax volcanii DS2]MBS8118686.1 hypothetical protein [Haloferax volcanii]MBS8123700.1 hypothetical protein [Haloferax volcanii]MBS8127569.1 hypothetical protein [Haloferax volcanii]